MLLWPVLPIPGDLVEFHWCSCWEMITCCYHGWWWLPHDCCYCHSIDSYISALFVFIWFLLMWASVVRTDDPLCINFVGIVVTLLLIDFVVVTFLRWVISIPFYSLPVVTFVMISVGWLRCTLRWTLLPLLQLHYVDCVDCPYDWWLRSSTTVILLYYYHSSDDLGRCCYREALFVVVFPVNCLFYSIVTQWLLFHLLLVAFVPISCSCTRNTLFFIPRWRDTDSLLFILPVRKMCWAIHCCSYAGPDLDGVVNNSVYCVTVLLVTTLLLFWYLDAVRWLRRHSSPLFTCLITTVLDAICCGRLVVIYWWFSVEVFWLWWWFHCILAILDYIVTYVIVDVIVTIVWWSGWWWLFVIVRLSDCGIVLLIVPRPADLTLLIVGVVLIDSGDYLSGILPYLHLNFFVLPWYSVRWYDYCSRCAVTCHLIVTGTLQGWLHYLPDYCSGYCALSVLRELLLEDTGATDPPLLWWCAITSWSLFRWYRFVTSVMIVGPDRCSSNVVRWYHRHSRPDYSLRCASVDAIHSLLFVGGGILVLLVVMLLFLFCSCLLYIRYGDLALPLNSLDTTSVYWCRNVVCSRWYRNTLRCRGALVLRWWMITDSFTITYRLRMLHVLLLFAFTSIWNLLLLVFLMMQ